MPPIARGFSATSRSTRKPRLPNKAATAFPFPLRGVRRELYRMHVARRATEVPPGVKIGQGPAQRDITWERIGRSDTRHQD
jgi:hypothetical protein